MSYSSSDCLFDDQAQFDHRGNYVWNNVHKFIEFVHRGEEWNKYLRAKSVSYLILENSVEDIAVRLQTVPVFLSSLVFLVQVGPGEDIEVWEIFSRSTVPMEGRQLILQLACSSDSHMCDPMADIWARRQDMTDIHLRAVVEPLKPFAVLKPGADTRVAEVTGIFPEIFIEIQKILNFTFDIRRSVDGSWGTKRREEDGTGFYFTGMMGMLERDEVDVVITMAVLNPDRLEVIDPSMTIIVEGSKLFVKSSDSLNLNTHDLLQVFYPSAWFTLLALTAVLIIIVCWTLTTLHRQARLETMLVPNLLSATAFVTSSFINKTHAIRLSEFSSGKILLWTVMMLGVVLFAHVRAGILTKLAVKRPRFEVTSLTEVLNSNVEFGTISGGSSQKFYETAPEGSIQKRIWSTKMKKNFDRVMTTTTDEGLYQVATRPSYVYSIYSSIGFSSSLYPCSIRDVGGVFNLKSLAFALRKNSPFTDVFNFALMRLKENGLMDKIIRKWIKNRWEADCKAENSDAALGLEPLFSLFGLLLLGVCISIVFAVVEFFYEVGTSQQSRHTP